MVFHSSRLRVLSLFFLIMIGVLAVSSQGSAAEYTDNDDTGRPEHMRLTPGDSADGAGLASTDNGYLSPVVEPDQPFTHMMLRWKASGPVTETLTLEVRSSIDGKDWLPWAPVLINEDMWMPEDGEDVYWSNIIYAGDGANYWQVRASHVPAPEEKQAVLDFIDVNTVDGRYAEDKKPAPARSGAQLAQLNKPLVVSRSAWGCPDGQGSRVSPAYRGVTHMVVHHTADPNTFRSGERSWGDRVRAIWAFHTYPPPSGRGWGDVGYNFLIDPNGTIYEGRSGGDNAVGFHDTGNYGSMGVSLVGTYESFTPPAAMQNSLVALLAWKAEDRGINPLGSSYYYGCDISNYCPNAGAITPHISGHRHVTPRTSCPGQMAFNLLPSIRQRVQDRLDGGVGVTEPPPKPDNGDLTIDALETTFARSDATWYSAPCGYESHTFYTYATDSEDEATNSATWRPNIPEDGRYRVMVSIPQGCSLGSPPYASTQAKYLIAHAEGRTESQPVDHNTADAWVDLGTYKFNVGDSGAVELYDLTGEPYSQRRVVFFDAIKWERVENFVDVELESVTYGDGSDTVTVPAGELLRVVFTVRNTGDVPVETQAPQADTVTDDDDVPSADIIYDTENGYVYDEAECFLGAEGQDYPTYPKETDRFRLTLGPTNRTVPCDGDAGGYPWRWGLNGLLAPGETRQITGYIRFRNTGAVTLKAGLIEEYVRYYSQDEAAQTITVLPEQAPPVPSGYDTQLRPLAYVYRLVDIPTNLLARTQNPLSIVGGEYVGSFAWNGNIIDWGEGGPLGLKDHFLVEQTRVITLPTDGEYTFRTITDDGSWLWIDGLPVVVNHGLPDDRNSLDDQREWRGETRIATGTIALDAGLHTLSFKYFEFDNDAVASYAVQMPGREDFQPVSDGFARGERLGNTFVVSPELVLATDDQGGSGVSTIRYALNGSEWQEGNATDGLLRLGKVVSGTYTLRYQVIDAAGNESREEEFFFEVNSDQVFKKLWLPLIYG